MATVQVAVLGQNQALHSISRIVPNLKKQGQAKIVPALIQRRKQQLDELMADVRKRDVEIQTLATDAEKKTLDYFTKGQFDACEDAFNEAHDMLDVMMVGFAPPTTIAATVSVADLETKVTLPPLSLPSFDGTYTQWETFRDRFSSLVVNNKRLARVDKLNYLSAALSGKALRTIAHLAITDANFESAWALLIDNYDHRRRIVFAHIENLCSLPTLQVKCPDSVRDLRDSINGSLQALENLKCRDQLGELMLIALSVRQMDTETRSEWERELGKSRNVPTVNELDQFLQTRIFTLEALVPTSTVNNRSPTAMLTALPKKVSTHSTAISKPVCFICKQQHLAHRCSKFKALDINARHKAVRQNNRCFNCLAANHSYDKCPSLHRCHICQQAHHTLLHNPSSVSSVESSNAILPTTSHAVSDVVSHYASNAAIPARSFVLLATAHVKLYSTNGRAAIVRALLDQGSEATLISENLCQLLRLSRITQHTRVIGIGDTRTVAKHVAPIEIGPISTDSPRLSTNAIVLKSVTKFAPRHKSTLAPVNHFNDLILADRDPFSTEPIQLLIGADLYGAALKDGLRQGQAHEPTAQNTIFGWVLSGPCLSGNLPESISTHVASLDQVDASLRRFWEIEDVPESTLLLPDDQECEDHFAQTHSRTPTGRYIVRLPFRSDRRPTFGRSRELALVQFRRLSMRLARDPPLAREYRNFMEEYEALSHMDLVKAPSPASSTSMFYIPHHAVRRETSLTTRLRVVFNASATNNGVSLNDSLLTGPKLQIDLTAIVLRWRKFRYVLTADIAKMYRQILVHRDDLDYQRILWTSSPDGAIRDYRLSTVTYGTASAPFLALRVLKQLALDEGSRFPLAVKVLQEQTYVDDCIFGAHNVATARTTRDQSITLLAKGGFPLRKWASNCPELLADLDASDHGIATKDLSADDTLKILGICWHPEQDVLRIKIDHSAQPVVTKRVILSIVARMFDPLGWITPVTVYAKILMQHLWCRKCNWDEPIPADLLCEWNNFYSRLSALESIAIPRWISCCDDNTPVQLHGFADASTKAYAAAVYVRVAYHNNPAVTALLISKSRVAPVNTVSVPRLELCAALLLARLLRYTRDNLNLPTSGCYCWTDSVVALEWISQSPSKWETFVANRVTKIQALGGNVEWRHVPTHENPADCASRGLNPPDLITHRLWWSGPPWLAAPPSDWPTFVLPRKTVHAVQTLHASAEDGEDKWDLDNRFSSWHKLLRVTAFILRFVWISRARHRNQAFARSRTCELREAKQFWIKHIQATVFSDEIHSLTASGTVKASSAISSLSPFLDSAGIIRVRGRLKHSTLPDRTKHPIILRSHPLVLMMLTELHRDLLHGGPRIILVHLRQEYWLLRARQVIRLVLYKCIPCTRETARTGEQLMGDLPEFRVTPTARPFVHTGVDYAGPILVKVVPGRGHKTTKAYIAVFICMTTKAIHLELVSSCSTSAFLAAYHRFVSRRGLPSHVYSDNGTNFRGADRELQASYQSAIHDPNFVAFAADRGVSWHFIPPAAPHFGGLWEAAVRSLKFHMRRHIGSYTLSFEEMTTLLCRIEACLNSRPLTALTDNLDDYQCLTPGHFLIGTALVAPPELSVLSLPENRLSRWELVQRLTESVWKAWRREYLLTLQRRPKWRDRQRLAQVGQIVLIKDDGQPPCQWSMGRIIECHPGTDGLTRVVTLRTHTNVVKRAITKLCFLPIDLNHITAAPPVTAGGVRL